MPVFHVPVFHPRVRFSLSLSSTENLAIATELLDSRKQNVNLAKNISRDKGKAKMLRLKNKSNTQSNHNNGSI